VYVGNTLSVADPAKGETSTALPRQPAPAPDTVNNVEYARFFVSAGQEFDVTIKAANIVADTNPELTGFEQDFALVITNAEVVSDLGAPSAAPQNFTATTETDDSTVTLRWSAVTGATSYTVQYKNGAQDWAALPAVNAPQTSRTHQPTSSSGVVLYRVIANTNQTPSLPSNHDVAFVTFTDDPVVTTAPYTTVKAAHIIELRRAVNGLRVIGGQSEEYTGPALDVTQLMGQTIDDADFLTLREKVNLARQLSTVSLPPVSFRTPAPEGEHTIGRTHIEDLRSGFRTLPQ
jgi:hypothetical protein